MKKATSVIAALFLAVVFTMTFESCGKYDEGPGFTLLTKKGRLSRAWVMDVWIDGATGTSTSITSDLVIEYKKDGTMTYSDGSASIAGTWEFSSNKEEVLTTIDFGFGSSVDTAKILRLTTKEFWIIDTDGTKDETHLKAK